MSEALPAAAAAERLTEALRQSGVLGSGHVREVTVESARPTILSRIIRLRLAYAGTPDAAPRALILKTAHPDRVGPGWNAGRHEVAFYAHVATAKPTRLIPRCYAAQHDAERNDWHLLLEDLTDTHATPTAWPVPPSLAQCQAIMRAYARFHAAWWDDPALGTTVGTWPDTDAYQQRFADQLARFAAHLGDRLPPPRQQLYRRLRDALPRLLAGRRSRRNMTVVHGDAHVWNCLVPKDGGDDVRLFDWDSWRVGSGCGDLAYMMAMHWYPDRRQAVEPPLLDLYHATLAAEGIRYRRSELDDDYRLAVLLLTMTPVGQWAIDIPPVIWWNNLERIFLAVDDLGCDALLQ